MKRIWYKTLSFSEEISEQDAIKTGGVLTFVDDLGEKTHYETHFMHSETTYGYFAQWPAEMVIGKHKQDHPGTALRIRTPEVFVDGSFTFRIYYCNADGVFNSIVEYSDNADRTLCYERIYDASEKLTWTIESNYDRSDNLLCVRELAPDGMVASEVKY